MWMAGRVAVDAIEQAQSGYIPPYFPLVVGLGVAPLAFAGTIAIGLARWARVGRRLLVAVDAVTIAASWTALVPLVFLGDNAMVITLGVAPLALVLVAVVPQPGYGLNRALDVGR